MFRNVQSISSSVFFTDDNEHALFVHCPFVQNLDLPNYTYRLFLLIKCNTKDAKYRAPSAYLRKHLRSPEMFLKGLRCSKF